MGASLPFFHLVTAFVEEAKENKHRDTAARASHQGEMHVVSSPWACGKAKAEV